MKIKGILGLALVLVLAVFSIAIFSGSTVGVEDYSTSGGSMLENFKFVKNIMIWFMLMLVAFLMIFIKKFEWGVALAVLLSAAGSFIVYLGIQDFYFGNPWNQDMMLMGVICAITVVIAIGCFLGTVKMWQYLLIGILFAPVFALVEWVMGNVELFGAYAMDPGGSMLVHMCAAYFGIGVAIAVRDKRAFNEPMYTSTHSVSFVWLASMLLWVLWPSFVTALLPADMVFWGMMTCYLAGMGSILSAWIVCVAIQKKVNPLIYTYAMLAGPVAIGAPLLIVGPWLAIVIGIIAGAISAFCFIYLQPFLCKKLGTLDVMGVHNLHGIGGWIGAIMSAVILASMTTLYGEAVGAKAATNIVMAVIVFALSICFGIIMGLILKFTRGEMTDEQIFSDEADFIRNDAPAE
ncbi:MAG: ammonium transporter [Methanomassiliicoccaceae archaeon]|nr:ammonium transporter [Methanomassiliicoccaceae archaeon]